MIRRCGMLRSVVAGLALSVLGAAAPTPPFVTFGAAAQAADIEVEIAGRFSVESRLYPDSVPLRAVSRRNRSYTNGR